MYRIPSEPTRLRATAWRRLRSLGAIYLQSSAAALPASAANERALRSLRHEIEGMGGTGLLLSATALAGESEVVAAFRAARDDEYEEVVDRCDDFLRQVAKEHAAEHFSFAELEENEVDLAKLRGWLAKIAGRDPFGAPRKDAAEAALGRCESSLEAYAAEVYAREVDAH